MALYVIGRKGVGYYRFRNRPIEASWTGFSERPVFEDARRIGDALLEAFVAGADDNDDDHGPEGIQGVDELHIVSTRFKSLMTQSAEAHFLAPMQVEEREREPGLRPAYEFEPEADELLTRCCRSTSTRGSTRRCWTRRPASRRPGGGR